MENNYLIPANTKKSQYILGYFTKLDLIILVVGVITSFILLITVRSVKLVILIVLMLPGIISAFLVMPVPHYHNVLQLLTNIYNFYTNRRIYYWKGWNIHENIRRKK